MTLRERLAEAASTHCPPDVLKCCGFCRRDRGEAHRFARIALESLLCRCDFAANEEQVRAFGRVVTCDRCRALSELEGGGT